jgi:hypothetical protein
MSRLGVYGENLPTRRDRSVQPADFSIAGIIGFFGRQYEKPYQVQNAAEAQAVFGEQFDAATYGWDALTGFFANLAGERGSIYVLSPKGTSAGQASTTISSNLLIQAAYQGENAYGAWNNLISVKLTRVNGFAASLTAAATSATVSVDSVAGFKIGDQVILNTTTTTVYTVAAINAATKQLTLSTTLTGAVGNTLSVVAYNLQVFVRSRTGEVVEVEAGLGKTLVTLNQNDPAKFIGTVFKQSSYIKVTESADITSVIADSTTAVYLTGGTNGTLPTTNYANYLPLFNGVPVRMLANPETPNFSVQQEVEAYCKSREDNPIVFYTGPAGVVAKAALIKHGNSLQRMDEVDGVYVHNWLKVADPFSTTDVAVRIVPNCGHLMGQWMRSIARNGVHSSPARKNVPVLGVIEPVGFTAQDDLDRTALADAGVNVIQNIRGVGIVLRNLFALSTSPEYRFANALMQRNFIKMSCVAALQGSENSPNNIGEVEKDRVIIINFMHRL